ncbi:MAG TPA: peptidase MA family metallohydrolase [Vicinamibacterales bacterium]|nr:peptidase MA family metallohydrolase [Vicinamibacterales bacterium]
MTRRTWGLILACFALTAGLGFVLVGAQGSGPTAVRAAAERAWRAGDYGEVVTLAAGQADNEPLTILQARSLAARGDYAGAEAALRPFASRSPGGDAALELGLLQAYQGRRAESRRSLQSILLAAQGADTAPELLRAGRAAQALGRFEDANGYLRDAVGLAPTDVEINTAWGELFLEKFNRKDAVRSFQDALSADGSYGPALVGMARAMVDENPPQAITFAARALELNPNDVPAQLFMAETSIGQDRKAEARDWIRKARAVNPKSLEAIALEGALAYVDDDADRYQALAAEALAIHPTYGEFYRVAGSVTAGYYRFDEAVDLVRRGIQLDRENWRAYADLGTHLMRTGDERGARRMLETAFRQDPYDVITYNLLSLLDTLDQFATIRDGDLVIRLHADEAGVMEQYVTPLAREALDTLSRRWEFTPKGPILVEVFPRHDDFAVRTVGLMGMIGALGACFGRVVTMDSPHARPPGEFNWGVTLWHEMAHVITLQLSAQRIPRWLTEGISVFEEKRARPEWGREMDIPFARALDRGQVLTLKDLNSGFTNPETISLAYFQSSLVVDHIVEVYGQPKLKALVQSYATGIDTPAAFQQVLGVELDALQQSFNQFLDRRYGTLRKAMAAPEGLSADLPLDALTSMASTNPGSYPAQLALGMALRKSAPGKAIEAFERAAALVPHATGPDSPYAQIAEIALAAGDKARAIRSLDTLTAYDHSDLASARKLATLVDPRADAALLRTALMRAVAVDPFDAPSHATLGRLALSAGDTAEAVRMFRVALAAGPVDRAGAHADLAEGLFEAGDRDEARRQALAALEIAPTYSRAQDLLLKLIGGR